MATLLAGGLTSGCLSSEALVDAPYEMCTVSDDCSGSAICDQGVCWGDPPDTSLFAAVIIPPADRPDLAPTELTNIRITDDGTIAGLDFHDTVQFHGRIVIGCGEVPTEDCGPSALVPAQVVVERQATFPGGPVYRRTVLTNVEVALEEDSFSISLPKDGKSYRVTVVPDETAIGAIANGSTLMQAPPHSLDVTASADTFINLEIGKPDQLKTIAGCITSALGNGSAFEGMHVNALGRWDQDSEATRASSIVTTNAEGCFSLSVPIDMLDTFDIVARPGPGLSLPTLRLNGEEVLDPEVDGAPYVHDIAPLIMPNAANTVTFKLPLLGVSSGGAPEPISGATVIMDTSFELPANEERDIQVTFSAKAISNGIGEAEEGVAVIELYPGSFDLNRGYNIKVLAPPDSEFSSIFGNTVDVGTGDGAPVLESVLLKRRVVVSGILATASGDPLPATPITVRPSPRMRQMLTTDSGRAVLDNLQFSSTLSSETGDFLLWLDEDLLGLPAQYDLELAPPDFSSAPRWTIENIALRASREGQESVDLGLLTLPAASYARGSVTDATGQIVPGAEVRWFQLPPTEDCESAATECEIPARLLGIWESDELGQVLAVLPDP